MSNTAITDRFLGFLPRMNLGALWHPAPKHRQTGKMESLSIPTHNVIVLHARRLEEKTLNGGDDHYLEPPAEIYSLAFEDFVVDETKCA